MAAYPAWVPSRIADISPNGLGDADVHVWLLPLAHPPATLQELRASLNGEELARASRFHRETDRQRYVGARALLRQLLGRYTDKPATGIAFQLGAFGKPQLAGQAGASPVEFNLSHSGDWALVAVSRRAALGVDIEEVRDVPDMLDVARNTFSTNEVASLEALPADQLAEGFFACWTSKEAYVKATALGLSLDIKTFDVPIAPIPRTDSISGLEAGSAYQVTSFKPLAGYWASVAVGDAPATTSAKYFSLTAG